MYYFLWFILGAILAIPLLLLANRLKLRLMTHLLGISLIVAALIYVGFAAVWAGAGWLAVELVGVILYGKFYWLAIKYSANWLSIGWLLHPLWDVYLHLIGPGANIAPAWYVVACLAFDLVLAAYIFLRNRRAGIRLENVTA